MPGLSAFGAMGVLLAWRVASRAPPDDVLDGPSAEVIATLARRVRAEAPPGGVVLLGEDHHSPLPDAIAARLLESHAYDCLFLELHVELQPAIDQFAVGGNWQRTVRAALQQRFRADTPAKGQDRRALRTARRMGVALFAVDDVPDHVLEAARVAARLGAEPPAGLREQLIDARDEAMAEHIHARMTNGSCRSGLYTVGWNHLPGLEDRLRRRGLPVWGVVLDHRDEPPLPPRLAVDWVDGVVRVRESAGR